MHIYWAERHWEMMHDSRMHFKQATKISKQPYIEANMVKTRSQSTLCAEDTASASTVVTHRCNPTIARSKCKSQSPIKPTNNKAHMQSGTPMMGRYAARQQQMAAEAAAYIASMNYLGTIRSKICGIMKLQITSKFTVL